MTNPESRSVAFDELALSDDANTVEHAEWQITEADIRELTAYAFDSDDRTWVGIGARTSEFPSDDRTLVGLGPAERAEATVEGAEDLESAVELPESVRMPQSEPPGPFVAADADEVPTNVPMQKANPWALVVPAALVAAAALVVVRGIVAHAPAPRSSSATSEAPRTLAVEPQSSELAEPSVAATPLVDLAALPLETAASALPAVATAARAKAELAPVASTKRVVASALGALDIASSPSANVVLDGRPLGKAPGVVPVAPGPHTVVFVHPERGRMLLNVNVTAGQTTSASAAF